MILDAWNRRDSARLLRCRHRMHACRSRGNMSLSNLVLILGRTAEFADTSMPAVLLGHVASPCAPAGMPNRRKFEPSALFFFRLPFGAESKGEPAHPAPVLAKASIGTLSPGADLNCSRPQRVSGSSNREGWAVGRAKARLWRRSISLAPGSSEQKPVSFSPAWGPLFLTICIDKRALPAERASTAESETKASTAQLVCDLSQCLPAQGPRSDFGQPRQPRRQPPPSAPVHCPRVKNIRQNQGHTEHIHNRPSARDKSSKTQSPSHCTG